MKKKIKAPEILSLKFRERKWQNIVLRDSENPAEYHATLPGPPGWETKASASFQLIL